MALHKMVNGQRIELTPEEEAQILEEWKQNELRMKIELDQLKMENELEKARIESAKLKLRNLGLTTEEIEALTKGK